MKMRRQLYRSGIVAMIAALSACSSETWVDTEIVPGDSPILLTGAMTRADGNTNNTLAGYTNLYLSAKTTGNPSTDYFTNVALTVGDVVAGNADARYLKANAYYPLGGKEIGLFAHTGQLKNGNLELEAGSDLKNDYLISNGDDGMGTKVSSKNADGTDNRAKELKFRHVMTKVEVVIETTDTPSNQPTATPSNVEIRFKNGVYKRGTYVLTTSSAPGNATNNKATATGTDLYTLKQGVNYLVPTEETLSGTGKLDYLKIDDYTATQTDLNALTIPKANYNGTESDLVLSPGLSYQLTFKIERLQIKSITLTKKNWETIIGNGDWGYTPYEAKIDFSGGYANSGNDALSKVVLHYTRSGSTYQYIGKVENGTANFVTLPSVDAMSASNDLTMDLYTANGLLIKGHKITYTAVSGDTPQQFDINLNKNGMTKGSDDYYEVGTPLQFYNLMASPEAEKYKLTANIDISHLPLALTPPVFPTGAELDGNGKQILHLNLTSSGLFKENKGTLKNLHLAFSSIDASASTDAYVGGICSVNNGTIEGCISEADITATNEQITGGICGQNTGIILACLNTGNVPKGKYIGGICGENATDVADGIKACINTGMLHGSSNHGITVNLGGICGYQSATSSNAVINTCFWLTGTARPAQGNSKEMAIGLFPSGTDTGYCTNATNMTETLLRTEAVTKLNAFLNTASAGWEFQYEKDQNTGTYKTVWPIPVKETATP